MQQVGTMRAVNVQRATPLHRRVLAKLVIDVVPAALTSAIGGFLITQYQFSHVAAMRPVAVQAAPASAEMLQLVRDEHAAIMDYLKAQIAAEKSRNAAADEADARAVADAKVAAEAPVAATVPTVVIAAKAAAPRSKSVTAAALTPHEPLMIAQATPDIGAVAPPAPPKSLLATTLDIKDHVVGATLHAVSAIGSIPSWIASMADRGESGISSNSAERSFAS
jgi:hypothetical protein